MAIHAAFRPSRPLALLHPRWFTLSSLSRPRLATELQAYRSKPKSTHGGHQGRGGRGSGRAQAAADATLAGLSERRRGGSFRLATNIVRGESAMGLAGGDGDGDDDSVHPELSAEQRETVDHIFRLYDPEGRGYITLRQFQNVRLPVGLVRLF